VQIGNEKTSLKPCFGKLPAGNDNFTGYRYSDLTSIGRGRTGGSGSERRLGRALPLEFFRETNCIDSKECMPGRDGCEKAGHREGQEGLMADYLPFVQALRTLSSRAVGMFADSDLTRTCLHKLM
jgi:hypothetical protein